MLNLQIFDGPRATNLTFTRFPVRLGRDPSADCRLELPFVSRRHATIDLRDGKLVVVDQGSRMGTWVLDGARRLTPGVPTDLESVDNQLFIGLLIVRANLQEQPAVDASANAGVDVRTSCYADANIDPRALDADAIEEALVEALAQQVLASQSLAEILKQAGRCAPGQVAHFARLVVEADPEWDGRSAVRHFVTASGVRPEPRRADGTALRAVRELASYYVPHAPPVTTSEAVVDFVSRLDKVLGVLLEGVASLRYRYGCEVGSPPVGLPMKGDLAAGLLDWTNDGGAMERMRRDFRGILGLHSRLVGEAATGVARILERLNPSAIETARSRSVWGPWGYKARWQEFVRRVEALGRVRERVLGPAFTGSAKALGQCMMFDALPLPSA